MPKVSETHRLLSRKGVWYYRRRVPQHLVEQLGKSFVYVSLATPSLKQARKLRTLKDVEWDARFEELESQLPPYATSANATNAPHVPLLELVRAFVAEKSNRYSDMLTQEGIASAAEKQDLEIDNDLTYRLLTNPDDPRGPDYVARTAKRILERAQVAIPDNEVAPYADIVERGLIELTRRRAARLNSDYSQTHFDQLFDPARPPEVTFGSVAQQHLAMKREEAEANAWSAP